MIIVYVTADKNWGIGKVGRQITAIPEDVRYIRSATAGQNVIMGRKTFETIPVSQLPQNRNNIVLSRNAAYKAQGAVVCSSVEEALKLAEANGGDTYILGGAEVFAETLEFADEVQVTHIDYAYDVDARFPDLDKLPEWVLMSESEEMTHFDTIYHLKKYSRREDYRG